MYVWEDRCTKGHKIRRKWIQDNLAGLNKANFALLLCIFYVFLFSWSEHWTILTWQNFMVHPFSRKRTPQGSSWYWKSAKETWRVRSLITQKQLQQKPPILLSLETCVDGRKRSLLLLRSYTKWGLSTGTSSWRTYWYLSKLRVLCWFKKTNLYIIQNLKLL